MQNGKAGAWTFKNPWEIGVTFRDNRYNPLREFSLGGTMEEMETHSSYLLLMGVTFSIRPLLTIAFHGVHVSDCMYE